jgi:hypothetical protein
VKRKLFFFGILVLLIYNITGCKKQSSGPPPVTSIYMSEDATTGIFNYRGIVNDSVQVIDSVSAPTASGYPYYYTSYKISSHQVSGQIRIKRLTSDSTLFHLTRPSNDNFDTVSFSKISGIIFQTDSSYFVNYDPGPNYGGVDTILRASYLNNVLNIPNYASGPVGIEWRFIKLFNGDGIFVNQKWEINYQTSGKYTERIASLPPPNNPMPFHDLFLAYHTYHLICVKQH